MKKCFCWVVNRSSQYLWTKAPKNSFFNPNILSFSTREEKTNIKRVYYHCPRKNEWSMNAFHCCNEYYALLHIFRDPGGCRNALRLLPCLLLFANLSIRSLSSLPPLKSFVDGYFSFVLIFCVWAFFCIHLLQSYNMSNNEAFLSFFKMFAVFFSVLVCYLFFIFQPKSSMGQYPFIQIGAFAKLTLIKINIIKNKDIR